MERHQHKLDLSVDRDGDVPLATQLAWKLRTFVAMGVLAPGERLPGVRELADAAGVNVNTVRAVLGRLEEEGLILSQHGRGTFVAEGARPRHALERVAAAAAAEARRAGLDPREVAAALFVDTEREPRQSHSEGADADPVARGDELAERRELRTQIAELEGELAFLEGPQASQPASRRAPAGHILSAAELVMIRDELRQRLTAVKDERERTRRALAQPPAQPVTAPTPTREPRVWRHGGVWTGALKPSGVVYES